ncbi:hypothetical protein ENZ76_21590, partial [Mesorhizobium sp. M7A.F.Ca.CA.002.10.1.1]
MRGAPAGHRRRSVQHPSTVSALRADPPSPTRGEGWRHTRPRWRLPGDGNKLHWNGSLMPTVAPLD